MVSAGEMSRTAIKVSTHEVSTPKDRTKRKVLVIGAGSVSERRGCRKVCARGVPEVLACGCIERRRWASVWSMDKKEINSTKMTLNFLVWIGGVFMLLLFALLAHFVWRLF